MMTLKKIKILNEYDNKKLRHLGMINSRRTFGLDGPTSSLAYINDPDIDMEILNGGKNPNQKKFDNMMTDFDLKNKSKLNN